MKFNEYEIESLNYALKTYLNNYNIWIQPKPLPFDFKNFAHTKKSAFLPENLDYIKMQEDFIKELAVIYVKTFYKKSPYEFSEIHYRAHCNKFNKQINSSENKDRIVATIKKMLNGEDFSLDELDEVVFKNVLKANLNSLEPFNPLLTNRIIPEAMLYLNPDAEDYSHFLLFLIKNVAAQCINLNIDTTNSEDGHIYRPDSLVLRVLAKDLPKVIEILERYEELYPEKVNKFGATYEFLGRTKADWFSYVFASQNVGEEDNTISGIRELNNVMNNYVLPTIVFRDMWAINCFMTNDDYSKVFSSLFNNIDGKESLKYLRIFRNDQFISQIADRVENLDILKEKTTKALEENSKISKDMMRAITPDQYRTKTQKKDIEILLNDVMTFDFNKYYKGQGLSFNINRSSLSRFIRTNEVREAMLKYYLFDRNNQDLSSLTSTSTRVLELLKEYASNTTYLSPEHPYLSNVMAEELENYRVNSDDIDESLYILKPLYYSKNSLIELLKSMNVNAHDDDLSEKKLIEAYINTVGLDNVIYAFNVLKKYEALEEVKDVPHDKDNIIFAMRKKRGKEIYEAMYDKDKDAKKEIIEKFSECAKEDYRSYRDYTPKEEMDKIND